MEQQQQPRRRRRPALSCIQCRRRKIKCDRGSPCAHCVSAKSHCEYRLYGSGRDIQEESSRSHSGVTTLGVFDFRSDISAQSPESAPDLTVSLGNRNVAAPLTTVATTRGQQLILSIPNHDASRPPRRTQGADTNVFGLSQAPIDQENISARKAVASNTQENAGDLFSGQSALDHSYITLNKTRIVSSSYWKTNTKEVGV